MKSALQSLAAWYSARCNGVWEHRYGFKISTVENPGVSVEIDLKDTYLETVPYEAKKDQFNTTDAWMICRRTGDKFQGVAACGRLKDLIEEFLRWAEANQPQPVATSSSESNPPTS